MLNYDFVYIISVPVYILLLAIGIWRRTNKKMIFLGFLFYFYIITLLAVTIFPIPVEGFRAIGRNEGMHNNFIPFMSILDILSNDRLNLTIKMKQIMGNIVLFIPMGFFVPLIRKNRNHLKKALSAGILFSFCIELFQYLTSSLLGLNYRTADIDDVLLNVSGFIVGFFLYKIFQRGKTGKNAYIGLN